MAWKFQNTYLDLPSCFYSESKPSVRSEPKILIFNKNLVQELGLEVEAGDLESLCGAHLPPSCRPLSLAYAGHQFGHFNMLGDGRAHLLGEIISRSGRRYDIQLKGSGQSPYSRRGDGQATLGPMLREYIVSEAMFALGISTTRSLGVIKTGEPVWREKKLDGATLVRMAQSHLRVGTFQFAASQGDPEILRKLADYAIQRHYPESLMAEKPYLHFLNAVIEKQAQLIADWMNKGFIHGVMNTDNMTISGETIDYGPCAFMDSFDWRTVFSSIDQGGRYSYENQPSIAHWNLARFAETLIPLLDDNKETAIEIAENAVNSFGELFSQYWSQGLSEKLGLLKSSEGDSVMVQDFLNNLQNTNADFTTTFRDLHSVLANIPLASNSVILADPNFHKWTESWRQRLLNSDSSLDQVLNLMRKSNPVIIPRNHLIEEALSAAVDNNDLGPTEKLIELLKSPYNYEAEPSRFHFPPEIPNTAYKTFCGT